MLYDLISYTFSALLCATMDFVFFVLVDAVAKSPLRDASTVEEKRSIWLLEGAALCMLSVVIYFVHHTPYLLFTFAVVTLLYTQIHGRVDFRYWWTQLATKWDEFQQHEESMEEHRERTRLYGNQPYPTIPYIPNITTQAGRPTQFNYQRGSILPKFDRQPTTLMQTEVMPPNVNVTPAGFFEKQPTNRKPEGASLTPKNAVSQSQRRVASKPVVNSMTGQHKLRLRGSAPVIKQLTQTANIVKSKVMSAIGYTPSSLPMGIRNNANSCFAISVLQCLARSKNLVENLVTSLTELDCNDSRLSVLASASTELLYSLNMKPGTSSRSVVDLDEFCGAAEEAKCQLFLDSSSSQQDAAEFLMWLLETLNGVFKTEKKGARRKFGNKSLETLRFIYGDLNRERINSLKQACRREIDLANGLQNNTYAEPIQRLSDLEWLTYKQGNSSIIDDQFTGQTVESQHCTECNRVSVSVQTFNVLPVPILSVVDRQGNVSLDDCLAKFGIIEKLYGTEGLKCPNCSTGRKSAVDALMTPVGFRRRVGVGEPGRANSTPMPGLNNSGLSPPTQSLLMSPIQCSDTPGDGGFHDPHFKTSTPDYPNAFQGDTPNNSKHRLTDGQRRSLLRHLPPCLIIQLMRFRLNPYNGQPQKARTPIVFPEKTLDMHGLIYDNVTDREDLTSVDGSSCYDLYGMCLHLGAESTNSGHYISYCKAVDGSWYRFDDDRVEKVDIGAELQSSVVRENVYLLFYSQNSANTTVTS